MDAPPPRSVLHVGNFLSAAGLSRQVIEEIADRQEALGWTVFRTSSRVPTMARLADMARTIIRERRRYSVGHINVFSGRAFRWAELSRSLLRAVGRPCILSLHGGRLPEFARSNRARVVRLLGSAEYVAAPSVFLRDEFRDLRGDIELIPNGLDVNRYSYRKRSPARPSLIWLRAFHGIYNPCLAVKVLSSVGAEYPNAQLCMVGPDKGDGSREQAIGLAQSLGIEDRIEMAGGVDKSAVPEWLDRGDIFLNTSDVDNSPVSVIEAQAAGLCVVSTDVGGMRHLIECEVNGLLVPANDEAAMAAAVQRVIGDPKLAATLSENGRRSAEEFDWSRIMPAWTDLFDRAYAARWN